MLLLTDMRNLQALAATWHPNAGLLLVLTPPFLTFLRLNTVVSALASVPADSIGASLAPVAVVLDITINRRREDSCFERSRRGTVIRTGKPHIELVSRVVRSAVHVEHVGGRVTTVIRHGFLDSCSLLKEVQSLRAGEGITRDDPSRKTKNRQKNAPSSDSS